MKEFIFLLNVGVISNVHLNEHTIRTGWTVTREIIFQALQIQQCLRMSYV